MQSRSAAGKAKTPQGRKPRLHPLAVRPFMPYRHAQRIAYKRELSRENAGFGKVLIISHLRSLRTPQ